MRNTNGSRDGMVRVVIYAAKSSEDIGGSIPTQIADCRAAVERAGGRVLVGEPLADEARSAYHGNRGDGLARAKELARRAAAEHGAAELWVQHSDRLARGDGRAADHLAEVFFAMRRAGVRLRSVQDDGNLEDAIRAVLIGERNHEDSARKSAATKAGKRRRFESGKALGGPLCDGYRVESVLDADGRPVVLRDGRAVQRRVLDPQRAPIIRRVFELVEEGHSFGDVQRRLNAEGVVTARGLRWTTRRIRETVRNPYYAGTVVAYGERVQGDHEPLIEADRFERLQAGLRRLDPAAVQRRKGGRPGNAPYLLRGIAFCAVCGEAMYTRTLKNGRNYICRNKREGTGLCFAPALAATTVEGASLKHLDQFVGDVVDWLAGRLRESQAGREALARGAQAERRALAALDRERERVQADYRRWADHEERAAVILDVLARIDREHKEQAEAVARAEAHAAEWRAEPDTDAVLDFYNNIVEAIRGRLARAAGVDELRATLHEVLEGVWIRAEDDGTFFARFVLRVTDEVWRGDRPFECEYRAKPWIANQLPLLAVPGQTERDTFV
jgi:hypothetical protein